MDGCESQKSHHRSETLVLDDLSANTEQTIGSSGFNRDPYTIHLSHPEPTVDGRNPAPLKNPWNDDSPVIPRGAGFRPSVASP